MATDITPENRDPRWSPEQAWEWWERNEPIFGCNYVPRTAVNDTEMWQEDTFDLPTIREELGWARRTGYNAVRVFLQFIVWEADPDGFKQRLARFLSVASEHGIRVMPLLFDDCAFDAGREPYLGVQDDPIPGVHNSRWVPSPGHQRVRDRDTWPMLEKYVRDIIGTFGEDGRVNVWDMYNEPSNSGLGEESLPLLEAAFAWARAEEPSQPLTVGAWASVENWDEGISRRMLELSDVVSFHGYDPPDGLLAKIRKCTEYGRPLLCTEWLHRQSGNTFEAILPIFAERRVGWYHWGLVAGRTQTYLHWGSKPGDPIPDVWQHDVFHPNGKPYRYSELELLGTQ